MRGLAQAATVLVLATLSGCSSMQPAVEQVVARWDGGRLTDAEYRRWLEARGREPGPDAISELAAQRILAQEARRRGAEQDPLVRFRQALREDRVFRPLLRAASDATVLVSDAEIDLEAERRAPDFVRPKALRLRSIHLELGPESRERVALLASTLRSRILEGEDFGAIAQEYSDSQSKYRDGKLGWLDPEVLSPAVADAIRDLRAGEISQVVELQDGFSFYLCEEVRERMVPSLADVRERVRQRLIVSARERAWEELVDRLVANRRLDLDLERADVVLEMEGLTVAREELRALAREGSADPSPDRVATVLARWAEAVAVVDEARQRGLEADRVVRFALEEAAVEALAQWELTRRVDERLGEPTEEELEDFLRSQPTRYRKLEAFDLALVQVLGPEADADEDAGARVAEARSGLAALARGEVGFADLAARLSLHPSGRNGGAVGWIPRRRVAHEFGGAAVKALQELEDGGTTGLLRFPSGTWILQRRGWRPSRPLSLAEARESVAADLRKQRIEALSAQVPTEALRSAGFEIVSSR